VDHFVADCVFAYLTLHGLIAIVKTVRSFESNSFASKPTLQAFKVNELHCATAEADIEERVSCGVLGVEADTAASLVV